MRAEESYKQNHAPGSKHTTLDIIFSKNSKKARYSTLQLYKGEVMTPTLEVHIGFIRGFADGEFLPMAS